MLEVLLAILLSGLIALLAYNFYFLSERAFAGGTEQLNAQYDIRKISEKITGEIRFASEVALLAETDAIPDTVDNEDRYLFLQQQGGDVYLVYRDINGDVSYLTGEEASLVFTAQNPYKSLNFKIETIFSGRQFSIESDVNILNLGKDVTVTDDTGSEDAVAIRFKSGAGGSGAASLTMSGVPAGSGVLNTAYVGYFTAEGGTGSYYYYLYSGTLPDGLVLGSDGTLSGIPAAAGTFSFIIRYTDSSSPVLTAYYSYIITVTNPSEPHAPVASDVSIIGEAKQNKTLTGVYTYSDQDGDPEGASMFKWYRCDDADPAGKVEISGATGSSLILGTVDIGKYIFFQVTPVSTVEPVIGGAALSQPAGPVVANSKPVANNIFISYSKLQSGKTITGNYTYSDADGDAEGISVYRWYRHSTPNAPLSSLTLIKTSTSRPATYKLTQSDKNKYIYFSVEPKALSGETPGDITVGISVGPVK